MAHAHPSDRAIDGPHFGPSRACGCARAGLVLWLLAAAVLPTPKAHAAEIEGVRFPTLERFEGAELRLHGTALLRWFFLKPYVGALYLGAGADPGDVLADAPKRLELHYFYAIEGRDFAAAAAEILERSFPPEILAPLRERIDAVGRSYRDVGPGDRYAVSYVPGVGTELSLNGEALVRVPGADFARVYFAIWLGPEPADEAFKRQLLSGSRS